VRVYFHRLLAALAVLSIPALPAPAPAWRLTQNEHFQIYAQASDQSARTILTWFEQLRAFFEQHGGRQISGSKTKPAPPLPPVRIILFASEAEYRPYRLRFTADAYYVGAGAGSTSQDYIVMASADPRNFSLAAHEYAHLVLRASGLELPPWLKEGLAEYFSTLRIGEHTTELGGSIPGRIRTLHDQTWYPLTELMSLPEESPKRAIRSEADLFYSESWALTEMLELSPDYAPNFENLIARIASGTPGLEALIAIYGKSADAVTRDLHAWVNRRNLEIIHLPEILTGSTAVSVSEVSPIRSRLLLAHLLLAAGEFDRAEVLFTGLAQDAPDSADVSASLGAIALSKGDLEGARRAWKRAIDQGIGDARLCYQYAILADRAGLAANEIRPALERAITLDPRFDDARYQLALLEKNAGRYEPALKQFQAIRTIPQPRAYAYWLALADTFTELGRREEAQAAAQHAAEHASTAAERARAAEEIYFAQTDLNVRFARDAFGRLQLVTTRMPHQQSDWNPFIEPGDDIRRVRGTLREIDCGNVTTIRVAADGKLITLTIPDLQHVQMRHAPSDFVCGPQTPAPVLLEYAQAPSGSADGILRGMDFE